MVPRAFDSMEGLAPTLESGPEAANFDRRGVRHRLVRPALGSNLLVYHVGVGTFLDHVKFVFDHCGCEAPIGWI